MNPITGKMFVGATLALSLSAFAFPVCAASGTSSTSTRADRAVLMQLAQTENPSVTEKATEKGHEVTGAVSSAAQAVKKAHRHHEATEGTHTTLSSKVGAKIDEAKDEVVGAKNAVKATHAQHEATEQMEGRD